MNKSECITIPNSSADSIKGVCIMCLNINSILKHFDEIKIFLDEKKPHIMGLNETKLDSSIGDDELSIEGYSLVRKDRNTHGGGVALYVHNDIPFIKRLDLACELESISVEVKLPFMKPLIITALYHSPGVRTEIFNLIDNLFYRLDDENKECITIGDINCNPLEPAKNCVKHINRIYRKHNLSQMIDEPTRTTSDTCTIIDHIVTNKPTYVSESGVIPCGISDHDVTFAVRRARLPKIKNQPKIIRVRKYNKFDNEAFRNDLKNMNFDQIKNITDDPNEMWELWKRFYIDVLNEHAPVTDMKIKGNNLPYINSEARQLIRQRDYLRGKANKTGSEYLRQAYRQIRSRVYYMIRDLRKTYYTRKIEESKGDLKSTWKILKHAMNRGNKASTVIDTVFIEGQELTDKKQIPEAFNNHFVNIGDKLAGTVEQTDTCPMDNIAETNGRFSFKYIQPTQVFRVLSKLKNGKAVGIHNIPNKSLKLSKDIISNSLADIFNASIINNIFPVDLKIGRVTPLFKGDSREDLNNYRPITVLPTIARVFERLIYDQLYAYFTENSLLGSQQWGFRSLHSAVLALNKATDSWLLT